MRVGFIGLGAMGLPMAINIAKAGHELLGCDLSTAAREELGLKGGKPVATPAAAAQEVEALFITVATAAQVQAVLDGPEGALATLPQGATVVLHATVPPDFAKALGTKLEAAGHPFLDAPISGGRLRAESGELTIMVSGSSLAQATAQPMLDAMSAKIFQLGLEPGIASAVKMINQHLAGVHIAAAAEAMALGVRAGADASTLYEVISNSAGNSWMFTNRVPHILARDFAPLSAVEIFVKDLGIVLDAGRSLRFPLPIAAAAHQQYLAAAAAGHGREDDSAVVKVYEQLAGIEVKGEG